MTVEQQFDPVVQALMADITDFSSSWSKWMRILIFGEMGVGKTTLACQAPRFLLCNIDRGEKSLYRDPALIQGGRPMNFRSFKQMEDLARYSQPGLGYFDAFQTYVIDKLTDLSFIGLSEVTEREAAANGMRNPFKAETDDRTENNERIRRLTRSLTTLDKHLVVIASAKTIKSALTKMEVTMPDFSERLVGNLAGMFDVVGYMWREEDGAGGVARMLRTQPISGIIAKSRLSPALPDLMINPTWPQIYHAYQTMRAQALSITIEEAYAN